MCSTSSIYCSLSSSLLTFLHLSGVYKRHEARLTLLRYQTRALAHSSVSRITDESWAMDGFVSIWSPKQPGEDISSPNSFFLSPSPLIHPDRQGLNYLAVKIKLCK